MQMFKNQRNPGHRSSKHFGRRVYQQPRTTRRNGRGR